MILFNPAAVKSAIIYLFVTAIAAVSIDESAGINIGSVEAWLIAINAMIILVMAKDKFSAIINFGRTPEGTLLWLAVAGGFPGLFTARFLFNHKTTKAEFIKPMWALLFLQIAGVLYYLIAIDKSF